MNKLNKNIKVLVSDKNFNLSIALNLLLLLSFATFLIIQRILLTGNFLGNILFSRLLIINILLAIAILIEIIATIFKAKRIIREKNNLMEGNTQ